ncbi:conjugal transfer protein [Streptacidiphilus sp. MAP12-16]|uniref:conjugal transfer protein n=1 Tax=Streptacidiphilus sp. MAP12-16 TaxID=3156300 RepID=UPI003515DE35
MFIDLWLRSDSSSPGSDARAQPVRAMAPGVDLLTGSQTTRSVEASAAVRSWQVRPGSWSVVVAVELVSTDSAGKSAAQLRYFAVPVAWSVSAPSLGAPGSLIVTGDPAEVAAPGTGTVPASVYPASVGSGSALAGSVSAWAQAYLTGSGEVAPLLAPGTVLATLASPPYAQVQVGQVSAERPGMDGAVPADGTTVEVLVRVSAQDGTGAQWPLQYALRMRARAGRWEVAALEPGPLIASSSAQPYPATTSAQSTELPA